MGGRQARHLSFVFMSRLKKKITSFSLVLGLFFEFLI